MSRPHVTITLGHTGQVVKRGGGSGRSENGSVAGSKRPVGARSYGNREFLSPNKRQRGNDIKWSPVHNRVDDSKIGRNDLRLKLIRKGLSKQVRNVEERKRRDLRRKLSKTTQPPARVNMIQQRPEAEGSSLLRRRPREEIADDLHPADSLRKSYSSLTINGSRGRSPDRILRTFRGHSPPISFDELRHIPTRREASRAGLYLRNEVIDASRQIGPTPITMKANPETAKQVAQVASTNIILQKSSHMGEEPLTVNSLLHSLGLGKYALLFQAEEVDMTALKQMGDKDLKELGIPMGPRKKILLALLPRSRRQQPP